MESWHSPEAFLRVAVGSIRTRILKDCVGDPDAAETLGCSWLDPNEDTESAEGVDDGGHRNRLQLARSERGY